MKTGKRILSLILSLMLVLGAVSVGGISVSADGYVYEISTYSDLKSFADRVNSGETSLNAKLMNDIECKNDDGTAAKDWTPIGNLSNNYIGTFDGDSHVITGLSNAEVTDVPNYAGLFGYIGSKTEGGVTTKGTVKNVGLVGGAITGKYYVGGVAGYNNGGSITNCYNTGDVSGTQDVGGVVGTNNQGSVTNCYNTGSITATVANARIGGVVGYNNGGSVTSCYNTGDVSGAQSAGGIVGYNDRGAVENCYNTGDVTATGRNVRIGGVVGYLFARNNERSTVVNCYNKGDVTAEGDNATTGGVVGLVSNFNFVTNCYNTGNVTADGDGALAGGVVGISEAGIIMDCYYDRSTVTIPGASEGNNWQAVGNSIIDTVTGLTTAEMTGKDAQSNMVGLFNTDDGENYFSNAWLVRKPDIFGEYYPHLRGFEYDNTGVVADWPAHILSQNGNTADNPYEIETYAQLKDFASIVNKENNSACAKLMNDIEFINEDGTVAKDWTPIGYCEHDETGKVTFDAAFTGTFDGDGHVITGLTCNDSSAEFAGLFGYVDAKSDTVKGTVKNVGLESGSINGGSYAGGVVGYNNGGTVQNCYNTSNVSGSDCAGGVVGYNNGGTVQSCYNTGDVSGSDYVGGVVGYNNGGTVTNCYNTGDVSGNGNVGGVAGDSGSPDGIKKVDNCYYDKSVCGNIGAVSGADIDTEDNKVKGLTTAQMTGRNAICYDHEDIDIHPMYFNYDAAESPWLPKDDGADEASGKYYWYYPQLKGFNKKADGTPETDPSQILPSDWPAKAEVTAALSEYSFEYDGLPHIPTVTSIKVGGKTFEPDTDYTVSYYKSGTPAESPVNAGNYKAVVTFTDTGHKSIEKEFEITAKSITDYMIRLSPETAEYTGEEIRPGVTVTDGATTLAMYTDYTVNYGDINVDASDYTITVTGIGNYTGRAEKTFTIDPKSITEDMITFSPDTAEYTGEAIAPEVTVKDGEKVLELGRDYMVSFNNNVNASENAEVIVTGIGNYKDRVEKTFTINPAGVTLTANSRNTDIYDGTEKTVTGFTSSVSGLTFEGVTASGSGTQAGSYDVTFTGVTINVTKDSTGNYVVTETINGMLTINPAAPGTNAAAEDIDYGQTAVVTFTVPADAKGKVTFTLDEAESGVTKDIENGQAVCEFENLTIGSHKVECVYTGDSNYESGDAAIANFEVRSIDCALTINYVYADGTEAAETYTDSVEIFKDYSVTSPEIEGYTPDIATVEGTMGDEDMDGKTVTVTYTANTYKVTYVVDGEKLTEMDATFGQSVPRPRTPQREGYSFKWVDEIPETMPAQDVTINGKFTVIEYTATFVDENGETVEKVTFTVEDESITEPDVPEKAGYTGEWEEYTLGTSDITIRPVYRGIASVEIEDFEEQSESGYKEDKTFTADASDLPEGAEIHWFVNGEDVGTGENYTVEDPTDDYTVQAKVIDKDGNTLDTTKVQSVKVRNGFFDRLKAFFAELIEKILGKAIIEILTSIC